MASPPFSCRSFLRTTLYPDPSFWLSLNKSRRRSFSKSGPSKNGACCPTSTSLRKPSRQGSSSQRGHDPWHTLTTCSCLLRRSQISAQKKPQPSLRRALSTAYYALFHLLISEAVANCSDPQF